MVFNTPALPKDKRGLPKEIVKIELAIKVNALVLRPINVLPKSFWKNNIKIIYREEFKFWIK